MGLPVLAQTPGTVKWMIGLGSGIATPALTKDGNLCFETDAGYFFCIGPNGTTNWVRQVAGATNFALNGSSPAIAADGTIYFGTATGQFYSFSGNGSTNWLITIPGNPAYVRCAPAIANDGTAYVSFGTSTSSVLVALAPSGATNWAFQLASPYSSFQQFSSPTIGRDGTIYIGTYAGLLYSIHSDGTTNWVYNVGRPIYSSPSIGPDESIYVGGDSGFLIYALDWSGRLKWHSAPSGSFNEASAAIGTNGWIYTGWLHGGFGAFDPAAGTNIWSREVGISGSPAIAADGTVYAVDYSIAKVYAFTATGSNIWSVDLPAPSFTSPVIGSDGTLYVSGGSALYAINATSPPAATSWPMFRQDAGRQARKIQCGLDWAGIGTDGAAALKLRTDPGLVYTLQGTINSTSWVTVTQLTSSSATVFVKDYSASNYASRCYRLVKP
jgi:outer membrane protein assembly factor BamB